MSGCVERMFGVEVGRVRPEVTDVIMSAVLFYHLYLMRLKGERQKAAQRGWGPGVLFRHGLSAKSDQNLFQLGSGVL